MRNNKNNIISVLESITSFSRNITSHFTGKEKIITLVSIIIMLSFVNITLYPSNMFSNTNVSALSYSSNIGIGFTFNPSISVSISPSNLVIDNLIPSITTDSNAITVSVATNAAYGYTLSATVNSNTSNNGNNNSSNSNLTHTNGTSIFSSIATDASLSSLTNDNTWGYSYRLSNNGNSNAWSNYSGLSNETSKTLINTDNQAAKPIDFKIAAKASDTQPSGAYTGTINFTAVSKHIPVSLAEAYASEGKTMFNGYYTMQDMNSTICNKAEVTDAQLQVIDTRDKKVYWIAKLKDGHCWMTQNLDLDLDSNRTYTHYDTDLGWNDPDNLDESATWKPIHSTMTFTGTWVSAWVDSNTEPYSADPGDTYFYTSNSDANDIRYNSLQECVSAGHNDCAHYHAGNYYNWSTTVASNDTSSKTSGNAPSSICPNNWRLPKDSPSDFRTLGSFYSINSETALNLRNNPLYFVRSGSVSGHNLGNYGAYGSYWPSTAQSNEYARGFYFSNNYYNPSGSYSGRNGGSSVRCLAR